MNLASLFEGGEKVSLKYLWRSLTIFFLIIWKSSVCNLAEFVIPALGAILQTKLLESQPSGCSYRTCTDCPGREAVSLFPVNISKTGVKQIFTQQNASTCYLIWPVFSPSLFSLSCFCLGSNHGFLGNHETKMDSDIKGMKSPESSIWENMF